MPSVPRPAERAPATIGRTSPPAIPAAVHQSCGTRAEAIISPDVAPAWAGKTPSASDLRSFGLPMLRRSGARTKAFELSFDALRWAPFPTDAVPSLALPRGLASSTPPG